MNQKVLHTYQELYVKYLLMHPSHITDLIYVWQIQQDETSQAPMQGGVHAS